MLPAWTVIAVPVVIAAVIAVGGARAVRFTRWLALTGPAVSILVGVRYLEGDRTSPAVVQAIRWLPGSPDGLAVGVTVDALAAVMLLVVGVIAAMVIVFSVGYMSGESGLARYYALLSAFTGAMSGLVVSSSLLGLFAAWELVGACSYLLIGFWFTKPEAARAAMKAFLVTRLGDVGLLLALAVLLHEVGTLDIGAVLAAAPELDPSTVALVAALLFVGAAGKSAQFPLHVWLPDAMEGPTPVSALIHAATMVAAGVFLVARMWPLFDLAEGVRTAIVIVGATTALGSATVAATQTDIKRVLAYSTVSQLGFMFTALGAGAWVAASFHLVTHAGFKALLFLASGSVIHGSGTQDLREMGGLGRTMPVTAVAWAVGAAALAGLPPLSGFFSKDPLLEGVWESAPVAAVALFAASAVTAFYAMRATRLAFGGRPGMERHAHESPLSMLLPLMVLAAVAAALGAALWAFGALFGGHAGISAPVAGLSTALALGGGFVAWRLYGPGADGDARVAAHLGPLWNGASRAYGIDALGMRFASWCQRASEQAYAVFDRRIVDGVVQGVARGVGRIGAELNELQSGDGSLYAALVGAGAVLLVALSLWAGR